MKDVICGETARLCLLAYRDRLRALVLTGSLARDEATFVKDEQGCLLLGDAEFLLVVGERAPLPTDADLGLIREKIEERVRHRGLRAEVTLSAVRPNYLRGLPPSIFAYELRNCGETVAGDPGVLSLIPDFSRADIPPEDAWRMLANRLVEQLEGVDALCEKRSPLSPRTHYRTVKLYLDMATSFLVFVGGYAPTYEERARSLALLADLPAGATSWPFPLRQFADQVVACTEWKLSTTDSALDADRGFWERAMDYAEALWYWELARLQGREPNGASSALMKLWMRRQPLHERLGGWAHVLRKRGWHRSWRQWPRWLRQATQGSPRYLVYRVASALMFEVRGAEPPHLVFDLQQLRRDLPVAWWPGQTEARSLRSFASAVLANYKNFVTETRA